MVEGTGRGRSMKRKNPIVSLIDP